MKSFIWKGPPTAIEIWSEGNAPELVFSGQVATERAVPVPLDPNHSQVKGWLAFKLIEEVVEPASGKRNRATQETIDG